METITAHEGWFVSHLFFELDRARWAELPAEERARRKAAFRDLFEGFRSREPRQGFSYALWGLKADFALMLVGPELQELNQLEYDLLVSLGPGVLRRSNSFVSLTETSEYMSQDRDYDRTLREKEGLSPDSPEYQKKMAAFRERMQLYINERLYPTIPDHTVWCFYPMTKRRGERDNWYLLDFDARKRLMAGHAITGRKFQAHVLQLVTGSIGLDDWEWGVTLFARDPYQFKKLLYEMRYDEASARYGEFGSFYIGLRLELDELFERIRI